MIRFQYLNNRLKQAMLQIRANWKDALYAGVAAGISWFISLDLLNHSHPIFAAMSALICLAPGQPDHRRQAIYVLIGVMTGVLIGEVTLLLPPMPTEVRIALVGFIGLLITSSYATIPAIIIQAGVSAIMLFAMGTEVAGFTRVTDVIVGTGVGLIFSQILFTPDQIQVLRVSIERFFHELADNFTLAAASLEKGDITTADRALKSCGRAHAALIALIGSISIVRDNARWTLRGRMSSREVTTLALRYDQTAIRLYAATLLFCEALVNAIKKQREESPKWLIDAVKLSASNCRFLAGDIKGGEIFKKPNRSIREDPSIAWRDCIKSMELVENTLARFYKSKTRSARLQSFRKKRIMNVAREKIIRQQTKK
ncbi:MAG: Fusaric acid resistance like protein [Candidatus Tokpelaia sp. JSC188]|nr:MAG: Fusaric acid resistance like protein [Candidatus Tokpelaia sp. JSC188]